MSASASVDHVLNSHCPFPWIRTCACTKEAIMPLLLVLYLARRECRAMGEKRPGLTGQCVRVNEERGLYTVLEICRHLQALLKELGESYITTTSMPSAHRFRKNAQLVKFCIAHTHCLIRCLS